MMTYNGIGLRLLGLLLIAFLAAGFGSRPENSEADGCIRALDGCKVCDAAKPEGGTCTVEICTDGIAHNCF